MHLESTPNKLTEHEIICGPFLRLVDKTQANIWFVSTSPQRFSVEVFVADAGADTGGNADKKTEVETGELTLVNQTVNQSLESIQVGTHCFINQILLKPETNWIYQRPHFYKILNESGSEILLSHLALNGESRPSFIINEQIGSVIQGSCRKPDHPSVDAFNGIAELLNDPIKSRPDYILMTGDQIYADDVAAPMLVATQLISKQLGLFSAEHELGNISKQQLDWRYSINRRSQLLPKKEGQSRWQKYWHGDEIISARFHDNHLIGLDEFFACYLLTWSSIVWPYVVKEVEQAVNKVQNNKKLEYQKDWHHLKGFISTLPDFEQSLANVPTLMMFDDHDVTDDWNLSADWQEYVYGNLITRQMIRDALLSYTLFQGWGNNPKKHKPLVDGIKDLSLRKDFADNEFTDFIYDFNEWHYEIESTPKIVVLDTRTHRWQSETNPKKPSGLIDFKHLEELERHLITPQTSILVVSPAPVFGVKAIEVVQKVCELIGKELLVDVENWMAHQGSAKKLMNMLRHDDAPDEVIIMSGDVHYSFCFSAERRFSSDTDKIWQLTCSGFKNKFPDGLLKVFDYIDRFLYSPHSILNIFTKRRKLEIGHHPLKAATTGFKQRNLHTQSAAGLVELDENGLLKNYSLITSDHHQLYYDLAEY